MTSVEVRVDPEEMNLRIWNGKQYGKSQPGEGAEAEGSGASNSISTSTPVMSSKTRVPGTNTSTPRSVGSSTTSNARLGYAVGDAFERLIIVESTDWAG